VGVWRRTSGGGALATFAVCEVGTETQPRNRAFAVLGHTGPTERPRENVHGVPTLRERSLRVKIPRFRNDTIGMKRVTETWDTGHAIRDTKAIRGPIEFFARRTQKGGRDRSSAIDLGEVSRIN
jgi:hypothetical protein